MKISTTEKNMKRARAICGTLPHTGEVRGLVKNGDGHEHALVFVPAVGLYSQVFMGGETRLDQAAVYHRLSQSETGKHPKVVPEAELQRRRDGMARVRSFLK